MSDEPTTEDLATYHENRAIQAAQEVTDSEGVYSTAEINRLLEDAAMDRQTAQRLRDLQATVDRLRRLVDASHTVSFHNVDGAGKWVSVAYDADDSGCALELHDALLDLLPEAAQHAQQKGQG